MMKKFSQAVSVAFLACLPVAALATAERAIEGANELIDGDLSDAEKMYNDIIDRANAASSAAEILPGKELIPNRRGPLNAILNAIGYDTGSAVSRKILEDSKF